MLCTIVKNSKKSNIENSLMRMRCWRFHGILRKIFWRWCFFFILWSCVCVWCSAVWSVHFTNFFFDSKVFVAVHYISFAKGKTKRNQFVYIATLCRKQQLIFWQFVCVCPMHYVRFSQFYWHFEILNRKTGYEQNFFVFHLIFMKLGEVVVTHV